jgi:hypothetical protein
MSTKTPIQNLYVTGTFNLVGNATVNGNVNITGNIILGSTIISEGSYNELLALVSQTLPGPPGEEGPEGPQGPAGSLSTSEINNITTSSIEFGSKGDVAFGSDDGNYYLYICYYPGNWGRILLDINF